MKTIITILLILTAFKSFAAPAKIYSQVCGHKYVEGLSLIMSNGRTLKECRNKNQLPAVYPADLTSTCSSQHINGEKLVDRNGRVYKLCISRDQLEEVYPTHKSFECDNNFKSDDVTSLNNDGMEFKFCVRELI